MTQSQTWNLINAIEHVPTVLSGVSTFLGNHHARDDVELALAEALNNYVQHSQDCAGQAVVQVHQKPCGQLRCALIDKGRAYRPPECATTGVARTHGYGWIIMRGLAKSVNYRRENDQNNLEIEF